MSLLTILIILAVIDILCGGAISASILGIAAGAAAGAAREAVKAATPAWKKGVEALKRRWWGVALAATAVGVWRLARGAAVGAYRGAGPGYRRGHEIRRRGHQWMKDKVATWQTLTPNDTPSAEGDSAGGAPPASTEPSPPSTPPTPTPTAGSAPANPQPPTAPTGAPKETGMAGENKGARPYVALWKSKVGTIERPHTDLAAIRDELRAAAEANAEHEVGGVQDVLGKLGAAIEALGSAGEALNAHADSLGTKWSGAVEKLDQVGAESAKKLAGTH